MDIVYAPTTPFAFTLRRVKMPVILQDYTDRLEKIKELGIKITDLAYEMTGGIHCHGVMQIPKTCNGLIKRKLRVRGWRIQLDELYDYAGWLSYITKENALQRLNISDVNDDNEDCSDTEPECKVLPKNKLF